MLALFSIVSVANEMPMIIDPMVTATPPGAKVSAGYMTLKNDSDKDIVITAVSSPSISRVEMHLSKMEGDVASMIKQDELVIKAGESLLLEHGSYHLMLMELSEPLKENDTVDIVLSTNVGELLIEMPIVKTVGTNAHGHSEKHTHGDHDMKKTDDSMEAKHDGHDMKKEHDGHGLKDGESHTAPTKNVN